MQATLVTGGAGYIGSHTVAALAAAGREAVILDDFSNSTHRMIDALGTLTGALLAVVEGDACDPAALARAFDSHQIDSVIHFAARKSVAESMADPLGYYRTNVGSTVALASACVERGIKRLVFSSSAAVYGTPSQLPITEDAPTAPESPYGRSKLMCERILADVSAATELEVVALRYFNPVGAHPSGLIGEAPVGEPENLVPRIMRVAAGQSLPLKVFGDDYPTPDGTAIRDYVHVVDLAEGHLAALAADVGTERCRVYNLGTGKGSTVLEVLATASAVTGREIPYEIAPRRPGDPAASWASCTRAAADLAWQAHRDLTTMLQEHWNYAR